MITNKILIPFLFLSILISSVYAIEPIERQEEAIIQQHEITRQRFEEYTGLYLNKTQQAVQHEKKQLLEDYNKLMWQDRIITGGVVFFVVLLAFGLNKLLYLHNLRKYEELLLKWSNSVKSSTKSNIDNIKVPKPTKQTNNLSIFKDN